MSLKFPSSFSFSSSPTINIVFSDEETREKKSMKVPGQETITVPVYNGNESVSGKVDLIVPSGKKFEHLGVKIEMIGHIG
jgi:vacuolar protein sorting-associated protein 26